MIAVAGLIVTAAITAPFFFVTGLAEQLAIAAGLAVAVAVGSWLLARRLDRRGRQLVDAKSQLVDSERKYRDLTDGLPLVTWVYEAGDRNEFGAGYCIGERFAFREGHDRVAVSVYDASRNGD